MTAKILDGKKIAEGELRNIALLTQKRTQHGHRVPGLAVVLVGEDPASKLYVQKKRFACEQVGFFSANYHYPNDITEEILLQKIDELNNDEKIDGILVQLPLPKHICAQKILESIASNKDIDGFNAYNMGKLTQNQSTFTPCTPSGIMTLLSHTHISLKGINACIVGASCIVGRPMALALLNQDATITVCHFYTRHLKEHIQRADLLIVAIGQPQFIQGEWIKQDAIVIDVGINKLADGKIVGDIDFEAAKKRASWITPVPGGVGPMTIAALLKNTLQAAELNNL